ncbi:MAG: C25 family cysteine peptidase [Bacteroidales bacterium]|nr:C25 family cysteine peptidase [Bacteroidales bacterium]
MKKFLLIILVAAFSVLSFAQKGTIALQSNGAKEECTKDAFEGFSATFSYENIESALVNTEKGEFYTINIEGTFPTGNEGTPQLPASRKLIAVPQGATPVVVVKSYTETEYKLDDYGINRIYPQQPSVSKSADPSTIKFIYKDEAYALRGYVNRPIAEVSMMGTLRNMRIASLTVNPVIYDAASNTIKVRNNIVLDVMFEGADKAATQSLFEATYSIYFESIYKSVFNRSVYDDHPDLWQSPVRMIVIAPEDYMTTLEPWLEWKIKKGFYLDVHTTAEAGSNYNAIKTFVHNLYNEGVANSETPVFLVLVGDTPQIPGVTGSSSGEVTDLYYSSVDGDYFPEMFCSRMCCENTTTLASLVEKILVYEQATMPDRSYLGNALLIAGADSGWNPQVGQPAINYAATYHFNTEHNYNEGGVHVYLNSYTNCYSWMNSGIAIANYTAHGGNTSWSDPSFTVSNVASLTNVGKYFLAIGNCCIAADFGYSGVCLAEAMIRANQKGAYTYIGSCPSTYWYEDYYWGVGATNVTNGSTPTPDNSSTGVYDGMNMIDTYNTTNSIIFLGNLAVCYAHDGNYSTHSSPLYYWQAYHVLGDGSIMPYCGMPTDNNVNHMAIVPIGMPMYEVTAEPGSYVAISKDGVLHGVALVGETGSVSVPLDPPITSSGDVDIVVTCHNKYPYMASVPAAALEGPYISVDNVTIGDDGILSYGETSGLSITIKNVGQDPTTANTTLTISCNDPLITIANGSASYPILQPNATSEMGGFTIIVSEDITDGQSFIFNTVATCNGTSWEGSFTLKAYKPILEYSHFLWPGSFTPGETIDLTVALTNNGGFPVYGVNGTLSSTNSNVSISTPTQPFGTIAVGGTAMAAYSVTIAASAPATEPISFNINASGDNGAITATGDFNIANSCNVIFDLYDSYGDGWNGASLTVAFDDGTPSQSLTIASGNSDSYVIEINTGTTVTVSFVSGSWNSECSFAIAYEESGDVIYESTGTPQAGVQCTFVCNCGTIPMDPCDAVENLTAEVNGANVELSWTASAVSYNVTRDGIEIATAVAATSYTDEDAPAGEHTYCVIAVCEEGSISVPACYDVNVGGSNYNPITNLAANVQNGDVTLSWTSPSGAVSYNIYQDGTLLTNTTSANYTVENVAAGEHIFCVEAVYADGGVSTQKCVNVYVDSCAAPSNLTLNLEGTSVVLSWNAPANKGLNGYNIKRNNVLIAELITETTYTDADVNLGETYTYTVTAVYASCQSEQIEGNVYIGINDFDATVTLYPNPANNAVTIKGFSVAQVKVYNFVGQLMMSVENTNIINVASLSEGVYIFSIISENGAVVQKKIVIAR